MTGPAARSPASAWDRLQVMARMQQSFNVRVRADWRTAGLAFYRAIWVECAELLDHYGWKWWKKQAPDLDQVRLEIVDIFHFGLSMLMEADAIHPDVAATLAAPHPGDGDFRTAVEALAGDVLVHRRFDVGRFAAVMASLPMTFDELFDGYVGKNVLNAFRQANGYAEGHYRKVWAGREDNAHLVEVMATLDAAAPDYLARIEAALQQRYAAG